MVSWWWLIVAFAGGEVVRLLYIAYRSLYHRGITDEEYMKGNVWQNGKPTQLDLE